MAEFAEFNFHSNINKAITACGYTNPTPVQAKAIPKILEGQDVVVSAQTGTGKTAAFVLPALQSLSSQAASKKTRVLILTPTRELASQITKAAGLYGKYLQFNIISLVGGMPYHNQIKDLHRGADIIVATPGRLLDHMEQKRVDLSNVEMLVLDEADRMLDMGFIDDVQYIAKLTPAKRQTLLFSATLDSKLMNAVRHLLKNPARIDLSSETLSAPLIKQELYKVSTLQQKSRLLKQILTDKNIFKAIIFTATKIHADRLSDQLTEAGFAAAPLHGDLRQNVRNRTLESLRRNKIQILVATDVAARGLDVSDITHVINFDLPRFSEDYVHRIGRTGRAGKTGIAISFVLPTEARNLKAIERYINQRIDVKSTVDMLEGVEFKSERVEEHSDEPKRRSSRSSDDRGDFKRERSFDDRPARKSSFERGDKPAGRKPRSDYAEPRENRFASEKSERRSSSGKGYKDMEKSYKPKSKSFDDQNEGWGEKRRAKSFGDGDQARPKSFRDSKESWGEKKPRSKFGDKKESWGEKSPRSSRDSNESWGEKKPRSKFGDKKESWGEKSPRSSRDSNESWGEKKPRSKFGDKKDSWGEKSRPKSSRDSNESWGEKRRTSRPLGDAKESTPEKSRPKSFRNSNESWGGEKRRPKTFSDSKARSGDRAPSKTAGRDKKKSFSSDAGSRPFKKRPADRSRARKEDR